MQANITTHDRNASPIKIATKANSMVRPWLSFEIMLALLRAAIADRPVTAISKPGCFLRTASSAASSFSTTGRIALESRSGTRPETTTASWSAEMKRRTRCSGITLTYSFKVATSELPAFSASQRRSVSSDQTLPTPAWVSIIECTSAMVCNVSGA